MFRFLIFLGFLALAGAKCPPLSYSIASNGSLCYSFHSRPLKFAIAEYRCQLAGGELATLSNQYVDVFVSQFAFEAFSNFEYDQSRYWTSGNRLQDPPKFQWFNGDEMNYTNWRDDQENQNQSCLSVDYKTGTWKDEDCYSVLPYVCQFDENSTVVLDDAVDFDHLLDNETATFSTAATTLITPNPDAISTTDSTPKPTLMTTTIPTSCEKDWILKDGYCYLINEKRATWQDAENTCQEHKAHLVSIHNNEENAFVVALTSKYVTTGGYISSFWIGLSRTQSQKFAWSDNSEVNYANWAPGQPDGYRNNNEKCGHLYDYRISQKFPWEKWNDGNCSAPLRSICKKPLLPEPDTVSPTDSTLESTAMTTSTPPSTVISTSESTVMTTTTPPSCEKNWVLKDGFCYLINEEFGYWQDAEKTCQGHGAHLVSIHNNDENAFVVALTSKYVTANASTSFWIGLSKTQSEKFAWSDNSKVDYINWSPGEPNNANGGTENCSHLFDSGAPPWKKWNDRPCSFSPLRSICKKPLRHV